MLKDHANLGPWSVVNLVAFLAPFGRLNHGRNLRHRFVMRDARARVGKRARDLGAEPAVVRLGFFDGGEFGNEGVEWCRHEITRGSCSSVGSHSFYCARLPIAVDMLRRNRRDVSERL